MSRPLSLSLSLDFNIFRFPQESIRPVLSGTVVGSSYPASCLAFGDGPEGEDKRHLSLPRETLVCLDKRWMIPWIDINKYSIDYTNIISVRISWNNLIYLSPLKKISELNFTNKNCVGRNLSELDTYKLLQINLG